MIELIKAILLGAIQGISEFLPISSTGHLILAERLFGISQETYGLGFDAALHLGTLVAISWFFSNEWKELFTTIYRYIVKKDTGWGARKLVVLLLIGTIPAVVLGLLLDELIETAFRSPLLIATNLILFSFALLYVERLKQKQKTMNELSIVDSFVIGTAQSIALIPGVSRSGITIAAGMWRGLTREQAARFAFLLSAPIIAGAGGKKTLSTVYQFLNSELGTNELLFYIVGMISAAFFGYLTIKCLLKFLSRHSLYPFIIYRIILGILVIAITLLI